MIESEDPVLREAEEAVIRAARAAAAAESILEGTSSPWLAAVARARSVVAALESAAEDQAVADRIRAGAYHLAGLLDATGLLPFDAAKAAADGIIDYANEAERTAGA